jgi:hypothetical protein
VIHLGDSGKILKISQIPREPARDSFEKIELISSRDGGASEAYNFHEDNQIWEDFGWRTEVQEAGALITLHKNGIYVEKDELCKISCTE